MWEPSVMDDELVPEEANHWPFPRGIHPTVRRIARSLGIPEEVEKAANELLIWYKLRGKRATPAICLASLVLASRMHGKAVPLRSTGDLGVSSRALMRALGELSSVIRREGFWDSYLNYVIGNLMSALELTNKHLVRERLWIRAKREVLRMVREGLTRGKNPLGVVALATYLSAKRCGLKSVSLEMISKCSGVHVNTIYRISRRVSDG